MATRVRPIRTKRDHEAALKQIELLQGAKTGTPEGDRLDVLATLVDAYEAEHYPIDPPDPIEAIKFRMEQAGATSRRHRVELDMQALIGKFHAPTSRPAPEFPRPLAASRRSGPP